MSLRLLFGPKFTVSTTHWFANQRLNSSLHFDSVLAFYLLGLDKCNVYFNKCMLVETSPSEKICDFAGCSTLNVPVKFCCNTAFGMGMNVIRIIPSGSARRWRFRYQFCDGGQRVMINDEMIGIFFFFCRRTSGGGEIDAPHSAWECHSKDWWYIHTYIQFPEQSTPIFLYVAVSALFDGIDQSPSFEIACMLKFNIFMEPVHLALNHEARYRGQNL